MWNALSLALPVLIPSWRFFKTIEPSPRVQWATLAHHKDTANDWQDFRPKPQHMRATEMLRRLFWNPDRNEALFVVSLAERIAQDASAHSIQEIERRIRQDIPKGTGQFLQFRLVFVHRDEDRLVQDVLFTSVPCKI